MRRIVIGVAAALTLSVPISPASADCKCRAPGFVAHHGQTVCLRTPTGFRLARCEMALNNSSWKFLDAPCPQASTEPLGTGSHHAAGHTHASVVLR